MKVNCKYFGSIAEITQKKEEWIDVAEGTELVEFDNSIKTKYPKLHFSNYKLALNQELNSLIVKIEDADEIAFFPPFGGG